MFKVGPSYMWVPSSVGSLHRAHWQLKTYGFEIESQIQVGFIWSNHCKAHLKNQYLAMSLLRRKFPTVDETYLGLVLGLKFEPDKRAIFWFVTWHDVIWWGANFGLNAPGGDLLPLPYGHLGPQLQTQVRQLLVVCVVAVKCSWSGSICICVCVCICICVTQLLVVCICVLGRLVGNGHLHAWLMRQ